MARKRKASDEIYNARRRYRRKAQRLVKQAAQAASPAEANRLKTQAAGLYEQAVSLYEDSSSKRAKAHGMQQLESELDPYIIQSRTSKKTGDKRAAILGASRAALESSEVSPDEAAKAILSRGNIGSRFYAGTREIWEGRTGEDINQAILDYYGADNMMQVLEQLENAGIDLYTPEEQSEVYTDVATAIQANVAQQQV